MTRKQAAVAILLLALAVTSKAADPIQVRISSARGAVEIRKSGQKDWTSARSGQILFPGTQLKTGEGSRAQLNTKSNDKIQLSPKTTIELKESSSERSMIHVLIGRMRSIVAHIKKRPYQVSTPLAVASVRGTEFDTIVDEEGKSTFEVYKGVVGVRDLEGIGEEVSIFKNQRTTVQKGSAPTPPTQLDKETRGMMREHQDSPRDKDMARLEARREIGIQQFKEHLQADVAREQHLSEYQDGKTVIDAFGQRVRIEEYIVRPDPKQFSFVTINTRLKDIAFSRYDAFALKDLPPKLPNIDQLFRRPGDGSGRDVPSNYIVRQKWYTSNGGDVYREWSDGGQMVYFNDANLANTWQVVFADWYVELKGQQATNFRLVSHWIPDPLYLSGAKSSTTSEPLSTDGVLDIPDGYLNYRNPTDVAALIGGVRPIDAVSYDVRKLDVNIFGNTLYQTSEGYTRQSYALFNGVKLADIPTIQGKLNAIFNAKQVSAVHDYMGADGSKVTSLRVDQYNADDQGHVLSLAQRNARGDSIDSVNFEHVASSPDYLSKIDLILTPRIFESAGLISAN